MPELEPYMLNIALEVLKILGGVFIPVLTIVVTIYAKKFERNRIRKDIRDEIRHISQISKDSKIFKMMPFENKKETMLQAIRLFVMESNYSISDVELELLVEQSLLAPKKLERLAMSISKQ